MTKRLISIISGRVQGVLFRDFTRRAARKLGLTGTVENLPDGTVKVIAEGEEEKLKEFLNKLKEGSALSKVKNIEVVWEEPAGTFPDFRIIYHGFLDRL